MREKRDGRMKLTIFGASGRTGKLLVEQALAAGHEVTAFIRDPSKLGISHEKLTVSEGDVKDSAPVLEAVAGADAVLSALGHTKSSAKDVQTVGTQNIVAAMKESGVRRLVSLTGAGVSDPNDEPKVFDKVITTLLKLLQKDVLEDGENHAHVIEKSGLDWIIVRGPMLTEGEK
ncbi:MAG: NAD(P)H-binding protein, partial [Rubrobacteraceae bacterium]